MTHGTRYAYRKGHCRCDECREWNRSRNLEMKRRNPEAVTARQERWKSRVNDDLRESASRHGEPWTEADFEVAAREDLTTAQVAARLGRTLNAAGNLRQAVRSRNGGNAGTGRDRG